MANMNVTNNKTIRNGFCMKTYFFPVRMKLLFIWAFYIILDNEINQ